MTKKDVKLGLHDGTFHADDTVVAALFTLLLRYGLIASLSIIRNRAMAVLTGECNYRADTGGKYDPETGWNDHHQTGGAGARENGIPYAAIGLVWKDWPGHMLAAHFAECYGIDAGQFWREVDVRVIQGIDLLDVGKAAGAITLAGSAEPVNVLSFAAIVDSFNPVPGLEVRGKPASQAAFDANLAIFTAIFERQLLAIAGELASEAGVLECDKAGGSGRILILDRDLDWEPTVARKLPHVLLVVFKASSGDYNVQVAPVEFPNNNFKSRCDLPEAWKGLRNAELQAATGVGDAIFCHNARFFAISASLDGALALARLALVPVAPLPLASA